MVKDKYPRASSNHVCQIAKQKMKASKEESSQTNTQKTTGQDPKIVRDNGLS